MIAGSWTALPDTRPGAAIIAVGQGSSAMLQSFLLFLSVFCSLFKQNTMFSAKQ
jgi:hypothetical protein